MIPGDQGGVAQQSAPLRPPQRRAAESRAKVAVRHGQQLGQGQGITLCGRRERGFVAERCTPIPGAHFLADIAAEDPGAIPERNGSGSDSRSSMVK